MNLSFRTIDVFPESFGNSNLGRVQSVIQICLIEIQNNDQISDNEKKIKYSRTVRGREKVTKDKAVKRRTGVTNGFTARIHGLRGLGS